jgi:serine/threonine-protein kinase
MNLVGQQIDNRYQVLRLIGAGGMAEVFHAIDTVLDREVAIKLVRPEVVRDQEGIERFLVEARAIARLDHPGIVRVYDVGITEDGRPYLVMELFLGGTLAERLYHNRIAPDEVAYLLAEAADALQAVHEAGMIHRDIKPSNIALSSTGSDKPRVKILDFGVARLVLQSYEGGAIVGTPRYMSPEQVMGRDLGPSTDIYALGVVAYEALAGRPPLDGSTVIQILSKRLTEAAEPLDSSIPPQLAALVMDMLQFEPARRPQSMAEVARRARQASAEPTEEAKPESAVLFSLKELAAPSSARAEGDIKVPKVDQRGELKLRSKVDWKAVLGKASVPAAETPSLGPTSAPDPKSAIIAALPSEMKSHADAIAGFIIASFNDCEPAGVGVLRLRDIRQKGASKYHYFAIFMAGASADDQEKLGTRTFLNYAVPLETRLSGLDPEEPKVVVALVDSLEIGAGVRKKIFTYREKFNAYVVPLHLSEVKKAHREGRSAELFEDRLSEFHTREDLYASREPVRNSTRFYGMKRELAELSAALQRDVALVSVSGPPGSGKTSLVYMAEYGLEGFRATHLRASEAAERRVSDFAEEIIRHIVPPGSEAKTEGSLRERIASAAQAAKEAAQSAGERALLVLEDADWLLSPLVDPSAPAEEQRDARELWTAIAEQARRGTMAVVVTSFYGIVLEKRKILDWENPAAAITKILRLERLDAAAIARMMREIGAEMNVEIEPDALREIHLQSGGNIDLARRLASRALARVRESQRSEGPLEAITIRRKSVISAARELESLPGTFDKTVMALLQAVDRRVLQLIAVNRPRSVREVKTALEGIHTPEASADSVDRLHEMGFVDITDGRVQVAIPLLAAWVRQHLEHTPGEAQRSRNRRIQAVAIGASLTALLFGAYWTWFKEKSRLSEPVALEGCTYRVRSPERGPPGDIVSVYLFRDCLPGTTPGKVDLFSDMGTVADIQGRPGGKADIMPCKPDSDCRMVDVPIKLVSPGESEYRFRMEVTTPRSKAHVDLQIRDDPFVRIKRMFDSAVKIAAALPVILGVLIAFHQEVVGAVRRLFGGSILSPPAAPPAPRAPSPRSPPESRPPTP